jgi:hypothetical protein
MKRPLAPLNQPERLKALEVIRLWILYLKRV